MKIGNHRWDLLHFRGMRDSQVAHEPRFFDGTPALVEEEIARVASKISQADRSTATAQEQVLEAEKVVEIAKAQLEQFEQRTSTAGRDTLRKLRAEVSSAESKRDVYAAEAYTANMYRNATRATLDKLEKKLRLLRAIKLNPVSSAELNCFSEANQGLMPNNVHVIDRPVVPSTRIGGSHIIDARDGKGSKNSNPTRQKGGCCECGRRRDQKGRRLFLYHGADGKRTLCGACNHRSNNS